MKARSLRSLLLPILVFATAPYAVAQTLVHRLNGSELGDRAGYAVHGGYDVDGDGEADLIVGLPRSDAGGPNGGAARVFSGVSGELIHQVVLGQVGARLGTAVTLVGDLDGDSRSEFLAGAPLYDSSGTNCGRAFLYSGFTGNLIQAFGGS